MAQNQPNLYAPFSVLVIEDQPFVRKAIVHILHQIGFRKITEADNGESGMHRCVELQPDLIVCDIEMKPVNGLDFLAALRLSKDVVNVRTPVVFLTVHTESDIVKKAMSLGVNAFVVKPPSVSSLKERVDRLLAARLIQG
ncbi:MAG: response regulator [Azospirillum sp.]|nr:response regulator [Azospirillum sp.]